MKSSESKNVVLVDRPRRWSQPFGESMTLADADHLLSIEPFSGMNPDSFPPATPLRGILANDCRILNLQKGEVVFSAGDYGHSAFLLLSGNLTVLPPGRSDKNEPQRGKDFARSSASWFSRLARLTRPSGKSPLHNSFDTRETDHGPRMFLQDIPAIAAMGESTQLLEGSFFGQLSAFNRSPRVVTVVAEQPAVVVEIRWQGLRDLMQRDPTLRNHMNNLYREHSLTTHLQETPLLKHLDGAAIRRLAGATGFESYGVMSWASSLADTAGTDIAGRIAAEPLIARQGEYCDRLLMIRSGYARCTRIEGSGEKTIEYLGKGAVFGLRELITTAISGQAFPYALSLRATGYVDVLIIPADQFNSIILPGLDPGFVQSQLLHRMGMSTGDTNRPSTRRVAKRDNAASPELLESIVQHRLMNGTEAMVIDLNRCTRCDDCVRACASTHAGTPRFHREGPVHDNWMFAHACMHCADPVCMIGCPTGAIARDQSSGIVDINHSTCIGCGTCASNCPYSNIEMMPRLDERNRPLVDRQSGLPVLQATKCDLCLDNGGGPACQRACPHDALVRIDLNTLAPFAQWIRE